ncbi:unnamed protein product [Meloidogyne enterolobii]|uniref:Uncharacterized protein n=1 Tax=Meloidogyne enterolobii TaxID=390850 RepID=A0ACB0YQY4_MELEN
MDVGWNTNGMLSRWNTKKCSHKGEAVGCPWDFRMKFGRFHNFRCKGTWTPQGHPTASSLSRWNTESISYKFLVTGW